MKTFPGLIFESDSVAPGLLVDYTVDKKIVSFDIQGASKRLHCHFWDTSEMVDDKPSWTLTRLYDARGDQLVVYLTTSTPGLDDMDTKLLATDDPRISVLTDVHGSWQGVVVYEATKAIAQPTFENAPQAIWWR
ncbi:hypothetical protein VaNZ11_006314 [Volvox africanus]|uniref:Uncharacterized protein n=1 Tax=Volvox africanus TaxID=51714 RepID=A0ABQ5S2C6_9CHLO|nr:hypothetical protein VaNZ11_006314 [Volvox africanus]